MMIDKDPRAQALIFDIDGTLADTMPIHYRAWKAMGLKHGFHYPEELFYELAGIPTVNIVPIINKRLGLSLDPEQVVEEKEGEFLRMIHETQPIDPVVAVARRYLGVMPMSLGTGGRRDIALLTLKAVGLDGLFDVMVAAEDVTRHKPEPDTFLECARLMHVDPSVCQVFEDGELGIEAAKRAGMIVTDVRPFLV
jgi:beta-phosphoglucomutase family hydrolase